MKNRVIVVGMIFSLLSVAILLTIYGMWLAYPLEISWLHLEEKVSLSSQTIQHNFNILMNYLTNPFVWKLSMPDFPSSASGLHHFEVVKYLFHLTQLVFLMSLPSVYLLVKNKDKKVLLKLYKSWFMVCCLIPVLLAILAVFIGFDQFFIWFHQILFAGDDTWMFDPSMDPVIWILPETFFLQAFLLFFGMYEGLFGVVTYKGWKTS